ncbi:DUF262 domain-containing protein [Candidatus Enterococcus clewellii]|uniref:GmrSD restriction endonucleases N-terminal domain-containing protein n=1 Tax=Candidatus Enterococcus clewellii TaxID=1834193 RepID=A0AAQ3Y357_9ENTE
MERNDLDVKDIDEIMRENLKIDDDVKSVRSIFLNERSRKRIDYKPYFQREYVWDKEKATYFIESIILGTEIPPIVFFKVKNISEVIDGRQRYETIYRFISDKLVLEKKGLKTLKSLAGKKFSELTPEIRETFKETKIRTLNFSVVNEPNLDEASEDKIKKEIFRRYNSGISPLKKHEIDRAEYIDDRLTIILKNELENDQLLFENMKILFLPKRSEKIRKRDQINVLLSKIRTLLVLPKLPMINYASQNSKNEVIQDFYYYFFDDANYNDEIVKIREIISRILKLKKYIENHGKFHFFNLQFYETCYWGISVLDQNEIKINDIDLKNLAELIFKSNDDRLIWKDIEEEYRAIELIFDPNNTYFRQSIVSRYTFMKNSLEMLFPVDLEINLKNKELFPKVINSKDIQNDQFKKYKLHKVDPYSVTIYDILDDIKRNKFLIRPEYQRSETGNANTSSYLLESVLLGIKIPPLFIFNRKDKVKEVIDGQQRLLTFLGFLGESYINENGEEEFSKKHKFKLSNLKIMSELNGKNIDTIDIRDSLVQAEESYKDKILDFPLSVVEIDEEQNESFDKIDLFLRLNTKPYPIAKNSFEMWNAYIRKDLTQKIKSIAINYKEIILRRSNKRMKNEEMITSLAYLDYETKTSSEDISALLNIYIRNNRVCARIKGKGKITKLLKEITGTEITEFFESINSVNLFFEKVDYLIDHKEKEFIKLFSILKKSNSSLRSDQNFYFLWIMLRNLPLDKIKENKQQYLSLLLENNQYLQNFYSEEIGDVELLIDRISMK